MKEVPPPTLYPAAELVVSPPPEVAEVARHRRISPVVDLWKRRRRWRERASKEKGAIGKRRRRDQLGSKKLGIKERERGDCFNMVYAKRAVTEHRVVSQDSRTICC
jgi:hypothetical protein